MTTDRNRTVLVGKRLREIKELADAAYWQLLDLRILLNKAEAGLTADEVNDGSSSDGEHYADAAEAYRPGDSPERD